MTTGMANFRGRLGNFGTVCLFSALGLIFTALAIALTGFAEVAPLVATTG